MPKDQAFTPSAGEFVFAANGRKCLYVAPSASGHCVKFGVYTDEEEEHFYELSEVDQVFAHAPTSIYDEAVQNKLTLLKELTDQCQELRKTIRDEEKAFEKRRTTFNRYSALSHLEDFLDGKLTHAVKRSHGSITVETFDEAFKSKDSYERDIKLLSLFGRSKGDLSWRVNQYYDGSGSSWTEIIPCVSLEEAQEKAIALFNQDCEDVRSGKENDYWLSNLASSAPKIGTTLPPDLCERWKAKILESSKNSVEAVERQLADAKAKRDKVLEEVAAMPMFQQSAT